MIHITYTPQSTALDWNVINYIDVSMMIKTLTSAYLRSNTKIPLGPVQWLDFVCSPLELMFQPVLTFLHGEC